MSDARQLDLRRLLCPLPVIRTQEQVAMSNSGDELELLCTDPGVLHDIPAWCRVHGHQVLTQSRDGRDIRIRIRVIKP